MVQTAEQDDRNAPEVGRSDTDRPEPESSRWMTHGPGSALRLIQIVAAFETVTRKRQILAFGAGFRQHQIRSFSRLRHPKKHQPKLDAVPVTRNGHKRSGSDSGAASGLVG